MPFNDTYWHPGKHCHASLLQYRNMLIAWAALVFKSHGYRHILREQACWGFETLVQKGGKKENRGPLAYWGLFWPAGNVGEVQGLTPLISIHLQTFDWPFRNLRTSSVQHLTLGAGGHQASTSHPMAPHLKQIRLIAELLHSQGPGDKAIKAL